MHILNTGMHWDEFGEGGEHDAFVFLSGPSNMAHDTIAFYAMFTCMPYFNIVKVL